MPLQCWREVRAISLDEQFEHFLELNVFSELLDLNDRLREVLAGDIDRGKARLSDAIATLPPGVIEEPPWEWGELGLLENRQQLVDGALFLTSFAHFERSLLQFAITTGALLSLEKHLSSHALGYLKHAVHPRLSDWDDLQRRAGEFVALRNELAHSAGVLRRSREPQVAGLVDRGEISIADDRTILFADDFLDAAITDLQQIYLACALETRRSETA